LRLITGEKGPEALKNLAQQHHTMPELLIDGINARFLEVFGDLLIDTMDGSPSIQSEYKAELKKHLGEP
jgi:hypothetical protein